MRKARKKQGTIVKAYELGISQQVLEQLMAEGKILHMEDGSYEVFSKEAVNGSGERAVDGDYVKVDSSGMPYPNSRKFFLENHRHISGDEYEQIPKMVYVWQVTDGMCPEVEFLVKNKGLVINETNEAKYFNCHLWGTELSAAKDAFILFYSIKRDEGRNIVDADFNFVAKKDFEQAYIWQ